jgi:hypothetical protein
MESKKLEIMKNGKAKKKSKTVSSKRYNKKKAKKVNKVARGTNSKTGNKKRSTARVKSIRGNKRDRESDIKKLSKEEREIYRLLETFRLKSEREPAATITKKRGDKLFVIKLPKRNDIDKKVAAIENANFSGVEKFLRKQPIEPLFVFVTLKIKSPDKPGYYFNGKKSAPDMVVNTENTKSFCIELLHEYHERMTDMIEQHYDEQIKIYNIIELSLLFLFRS